MKKLTVLWIDDQRNPIKYLNGNNKSNAFYRNKEFYDELAKSYDIYFVWVKNLYQFVNHIKNNGLPNFISFDYDLNSREGGEGLTGLQKSNNNGINCARWLIKYCKETNQTLPKFYVHSANPKHGPEINKTLNNAPKEK